jgi:hypothetical protein
MPGRPLALAKHPRSGSNKSVQGVTDGMACPEREATPTEADFTHRRYRGAKLAGVFLSAGAPIANRACPRWFATVINKSAASRRPPRVR